MHLRIFQFWLLMVGLLSPVSSFSTTLSEPSDSPSVSSRTYKKLKAAQVLMKKSDYRKALEQLDQLLPSVNDSPYEKAVVLKSIASVYTLQDKYGKAAEAMKKCLAIQALPYPQEQQVLINLVQIYIKLERYQQAADIMEPWVTAAENVSADQYILLAHVFAQLKRYRKALPYVKKAISAAKHPKESWYQLLLAMNYELKDLPATTAVLKDLIRKFPPKKQYWQQLASVYQQIKQYEKAVSVRELAYHSGFLTTQGEIIDLVNFFLFVDAPYKGATLMEKELAKGAVKKTAGNYELLANAWTQAREFDLAAQALEKSSALSDKGELYFLLGRIFIEQDKWSNAYKALLNAFKKGQLKDPGNAYILLGMASYELDLKKEAKNAFKKAQRYKKSSKTAQQWLNYLRDEPLNLSGLFQTQKRRAVKSSR